MSKIKQISVVYNEAPFIVVNYENVQVPTGNTVEQISFAELGSYIRLAEQQAALDGLYVNFNKSSYEYNNKTYPAITIYISENPFAPVTQYQDKTVKFNNRTSGFNLGYFIRYGYFVNQTIDFQNPGEDTERLIRWVGTGSNPVSPIIYVFDAGGLPGTPFNDTGSVPVQVWLERNGSPIPSTIQAVQAGSCFTFAIDDWQSNWDRIVITDGATPQQFVVKPAVALPGICTAPSTQVYCTDNPIIVGSTLYTDTGLSIPLAGNFVVLPDGLIYNMAAGVIGAATGGACQGSFTQISNVDNGDGTRTQRANIGATVITGNKYNCAVYSHIVSYTVQPGDTVATILFNLINAVNATTADEWNDNNSAPAIGTPGFRPVATAIGFTDISITLNINNQFAFWIE